MSDVMPSLVTKTLSSSSLPVNSSATTYRLGVTLLATSSMYCSTPPGEAPHPAQAQQERGGGRLKRQERGGGVNGSSQITSGRVQATGREKEEEKRRFSWCCTSYEAANSQPVNKHVVKELAASKELSDHVQIGSDSSGGV